MEYQTEAPVTFLRCYVTLIEEDFWHIRCGLCGLEWDEPQSEDLIVAITCPFCRAMQCVLYPEGIAYNGPCMDT